MTKAPARVGLQRGGFLCFQVGELTRKQREIYRLVTEPMADFRLAAQFLIEP